MSAAESRGFNLIRLCYTMDQLYLHFLFSLVLYSSHTTLGHCPLRQSGSISCDVTVRTGSVSRAGTDADVYIIFHGTSSSNRFYPDNPGNNDFETGDVDKFQTTIPNLFPLTHIDVGHDNSGTGPGWFLDSIDVYCPDGEIDVHFPCNRWLATDEEDRKLEVTLRAQNNRQCPERQPIPNGAVTCTDGRIWGSRCTYTCTQDNYLLRGHDCVHCRSTLDWTDVEGSTTCDDLCHWRLSHCWPGHCTGTTGQQLATTCSCQQGFKLTVTNGYRCDLDTSPAMSTCRVAVIDSGRTSTNSSYTGPGTNCQNQRDEGIKTVPVQLYFSMKAGLDLPLTEQQAYISSSKVGLIGLHLTVVHVSLSGSEIVVKQETYTGPPYCRRSVSSLDPAINGEEHDCEGAVDVSAVTLQDGDNLCADMKASGGGFYAVTDYRQVFQNSPTFTPTYSATKRVCFTYDRTKPVHCTQQTGRPCSSQPLTLSTRLTRHPEIEVTVDGGRGSRPPGGENNDKSAAGVAWFKLEVHRVNVGRATLSVEEGAILELTQQWNTSSYSYPTGAGTATRIVSLPQSDEAQLYALIMEVHDNAGKDGGNVGYARRLVLHDNSSSVELIPKTSLSVIHANPSSNYRWQTDITQRLCVNWTGHFYNTDMYHNNFLLPVTSDTGRAISGQYDQISGDLPITGINNVLGVTKFEVTF